MNWRVPARYDDHPADQFADAIWERVPFARDILDVGSGRRPAIPPEARPAGCRRYVGLDLSAAELSRAPVGSYTETVVRDLAEPRRELMKDFDLLVCRQVLEHVGSLESALANLRGYLRPCGHLVALLSGRFSIPGTLNRLMPALLSRFVLHRLLERDPDTVFPARYDRCYHRALTHLLTPWRQAQIIPIYQGGAYLNFSRPLRAAYFVYESWAERTSQLDLATHYLIVAER